MASVKIEITSSVASPKYCVPQSLSQFQVQVIHFCEKNHEILEKTHTDGYIYKKVQTRNVKMSAFSRQHDLFTVTMSSISKKYWQISSQQKPHAARIFHMQSNYHKSRQASKAPSKEATRNHFILYLCAILSQRRRFLSSRHLRGLTLFICWAIAVCSREKVANCAGISRACTR